jgi:hypothetical protein
VKALLKGYCEGTLDRPAVEEILEIGRSRFFSLLNQYRRGPNNFSLAYQKETPTMIPAWVEKEIERELIRYIIEKKLPLPLVL